MKITFEPKFEDLDFKPFRYNREKPRVASFSGVHRGFLYLTKTLKFAIMKLSLKREGHRKMKVTKKNASKAFELGITSVVILLNEAAAFLWVRDNVSNGTIAYAIAGFAVFCSTYIVFKTIYK